MTSRYKALSIPYTTTENQDHLLERHNSASFSSNELWTCDNLRVSFLISFFRQFTVSLSELIFSKAGVRR